MIKKTNKIQQQSIDNKSIDFSTISEAKAELIILELLQEFNIQYKLERRGVTVINYTKENVEFAIGKWPNPRHWYFHIIDKTSTFSIPFKRIEHLKTLIINNGEKAMTEKEIDNCKDEFLQKLHNYGIPIIKPTN